MADRSELLNDDQQALRLALDARQSAIWTAIPGVVQSVDLTAMTCEVQPSIQGLIQNEDGTTQNVDYPLLVDVPIVFPRAGNFIITMPLAAGDEVLVVFASRCIDSWWQSGGFQNRPMEVRMHDLSDGFAIPGPSSQPKKVSGISSNSIQIRNLAGTSYVEIAADGKIKIVAPAEIDVTAPLINVTGSMVVSGSVTAGSFITAGNITASSGTVSAAAITASGAVTGLTVVGGGKSLSTHIHSAVTPGIGNSGPPV